MNRKRRKIKRSLKILLIILITILIVFSMNKNKENHNINIEKVNDYMYILVNKKNELNSDFKPDNLVEVKFCSLDIFYLDQETANEYKKMTSSDLEKELVELKSELFKLRFSLATNGLENPMKIKEVKKDIARINTVLTQRKLAENK